MHWDVGFCEVSDDAGAGKLEVYCEVAGLTLEALTRHTTSRNVVTSGRLIDQRG